MNEVKKGIFLKRSEIERIRNKRLRFILNYVNSHSPFYKRFFKECGVDIDKIKTVEDLKELPFTTKQHLRDAYPLGLSAVSKEKIVRIQMSGGTTGQPVIVPYTRKDVEHWKNMMLRAFYLSNITSKDVIQITPAFGLWNGGFGFHFAADAIDAFVIPIGSGNTRTQVKFMVDFGTTVLCGTASYPLRIAEVAQEMGYDPSELPVKKMLLGAEPWSDKMREQIERTFSATAYDIPGLTEMGGVGTVGFECPARSGLHMWEDCYVIEIIDPNTGDVLDEGEEGEVVYTSLCGEAMPLIRYRSGEVSKIISTDKCECGIEHITIGRIKGRTDDMIIYKGVKFYPSDVEQILASYGIKHYKIVVGEDIKILFEGENGITGNIAKDIKEFLGFNPNLRALPSQTLERYEGKARRVFRR